MMLNKINSNKKIKKIWDIKKIKGYEIIIKKKAFVILELIQN
jgi:hypothetical protein